MRFVAAVAATLDVKFLLEAADVAIELALG